MANPQRGEVELIIEGQPYILRYTLGACAEIMAAFELADIGDIPNIDLRNLSNLAKFISFGVKGGGGELTVEQIMSSTVHIPEAIEAVSKAVILGIIGERPLPETPAPGNPGTGELPGEGQPKPD